jgi:hypothetical protein
MGTSPSLSAGKAVAAWAQDRWEHGWHGPGYLEGRAGRARWGLDGHCKTWPNPHHLQEQPAGFADSRAGRVCGLASQASTIIEGVLIHVLSIAVTEVPGKEVEDSC